MQLQKKNIFVRGMRAENQQFRKHTLRPFQPYFILKNKRGMKLMPIARTLNISVNILKTITHKTNNECAKPEQRVEQEHLHYG